MSAPKPPKRRFEFALEETRRQYSFWITGYVVLPEHVPLLISEPERASLSRALQSLKRSPSARTRPRSRPDSETPQET